MDLYNKNENTPPIGKLYTKVDWKLLNGFDVMRFETPTDGNCMFHAISNAFFTPYHTEILNGQKTTRNNIIKNFRKSLSDKLGETIDDTGKTYYDTLNNGNTATFALDVPEFTLENMQKTLDSTDSIGFGFLEFISNVLGIDIYILNSNTQDIYVTDELLLSIRCRNSIILYYMDGHYELVGVKNCDKFVTYFLPTNPLITRLRDRVIQLIKK